MRYGKAIWRASRLQCNRGCTHTARPLTPVGVHPYTLRACQAPHTLRARCHPHARPPAAPAKGHVAFRVPRCLPRLFGLPPTFRVTVFTGSVTHPTLHFSRLATPRPTGATQPSCSRQSRLLLHPSFWLILDVSPPHTLNSQAHPLSFPAPKGVKQCRYDVCTCFGHSQASQP